MWGRLCICTGWSIEMRHLTLAPGQQISHDSLIFSMRERQRNWAFCVKNPCRPFMKTPFICGHISAQAKYWNIVIVRDLFAGHDLAWADVQICSPPPSSYLACHAELEDWTETGGDRNSEREAAAKGGGNLVMKPSGDYSHARVLASIEVILWKGRHSSYLDSKGSKKNHASVWN